MTAQFDVAPREAIGRAYPSYGERIEIRRVTGQGYAVLSHRPDGQTHVLGMVRPAPRRGALS